MIRCPQLSDLPLPPGPQRGWPWTESTSLPGKGAGRGMGWPRITIVTPSFNQGEFIEETIRSVLLQGYPNLEYIIIDGGSTDDTVEIIKKYEPWLSYWVSEPDSGQTHALNKGFAKATGKIYGFLNSDDLYNRGTLQKITSLLDASLASPTLLTCTGAFFKDSQEELYTPPPAPTLENWLSSPVSLFQPSTFWTRELHNAVGCFNEELHFCFDKDFFIRCVLCDAAYIAMPQLIAAKLRVHPQTKTSKMNEAVWTENQSLWAMYNRDEILRQKIEANLNNSQRRRIRRSVRRLRREQSSRIARSTTSSALAARGLFSKSRLLLKAAFMNPAEVVTRFYLGAWKRTLFGSMKSGNREVL